MEGRRLLETVKESFSGPGALFERAEHELKRFGDRLKELGGLPAESERRLAEWQERTREGWRRTDQAVERMLGELQGLVRLPSQEDLTRLRERITALEERFSALQAHARARGGQARRRGA